MTCRIDRLWPLRRLSFLAGCIRFHKTYLAQIFGPPKIGPDGYPGRPMARPSAILERFWLQNDFQNGTKKWSNSDFGEIVIFATPHMRNQRFHCPGTLQKWCKISTEKDSATRPPLKSSIFNLRAPLDGNMNRKGFQKGSFWGGQGHQKQPWGWKFRILGGSGCRVFFFLLKRL